ncbi:MAG: glycosyltransferase family 39 protein, partial [Pseudomonadota bacterium]
MTDTSKLNKSDRRRLVIATLIFLAVTTVVAVTARDSGLTWDEAIYFDSGVRYLEWFRNLSGDSFSEQAIGATWFQPDHPPLAKVWIAFSLALFRDAFGPIAGARVGAGVLFGLAAATIFLYLSGRGRAREGIIAALAFVLMPRVFAHGHFANLEMLTLLLWMLTIMAFAKGLESRVWSVACGALFGLALLTKINGAFLPIVLVPWGILFHGRKAIRNIIFMAVLGPLFFFGLWPVMWHHPILASKGYLANKLARSIVPTYYLGTTYANT